jgi:7,8-dihydropterin-6-yl-methyl-4-(beta-D-ribofuranosyl)aminobenzene 5'-phosphate synthase
MGINLEERVVGSAPGYISMKKTLLTLIILIPLLMISSCVAKDSQSRSANPITKAEDQSPAVSPTDAVMPDPSSTPSISEDEGKVIDKITITVVFDNYPYREGLETEWGFSAYVTYKESNVLFDTGLDGPILLSNLGKLGIQTDKIQHLVLSHEHSDHTGGLGALLPETRDLKVYILPSFPAYLKGQITHWAEAIEVVPVHPITERISTTGEISGYPNEQSLVIDTQDGLVVIAGCSHPGIEKIVLEAKRQFKEDIYLVMGGFHLGGAPNSDIQTVIQEFKRIGVQKVAPSHCTGDNAILLFREAFGEDFIRIGAGAVIEIEIIDS